MNCFHFESKDRRGRQHCSLTVWKIMWTDDNPVRVVDVFIDELDLAMMELLALRKRRDGGDHRATLLATHSTAISMASNWSRRLERNDPAQHRVDVADRPLDAGFTIAISAATIGW